MRTATEFVEAVENLLGWVPADPRWRTIRIEASKVKRKQSTDPVLYSFDNLELALALMRKEHKEVQSPVAVLWHVERALKLAEVTVETDELDRMIGNLVEYLSEVGDPEHWIPRLVRAQGDGKAMAIEEFRNQFPDFSSWDRIVRGDGNVQQA